MNRPRAGSVGVVDRLKDRGAGLFLPPLNGGEAVVAFGHIAPNGVYAQKGKAGFFQRLHDGFAGGLVGPVHLNRFEPGLFRPADRLRQGEFRPEEPEIGGKARHQSHSTSKWSTTSAI